MFDFTFGKGFFLTAEKTHTVIWKEGVPVAKIPYDLWVMIIRNKNILSVDFPGYNGTEWCIEKRWDKNGYIELSCFEHAD